LFAGPIWRAEHFFAQTDRQRPARRVGSPRQGWLALYLIVLGLVQKVVLASWLSAQVVDPVYKSPDQFASVSLGAAMLGYSLQIFLDFAGYTLIVTGLALLLGYRLPVNFRQPYLARNLSDFWTRWHVSLSSFIRDYIYIHLGGNLLGWGRTQLNVLSGMLISGLWHGANWTFVVWGLLHGLGVVVQQNLERLNDEPLLFAQLSSNRSGDLLVQVSPRAGGRETTLLWKRDGGRQSLVLEASGPIALLPQGGEVIVPVFDRDLDLSRGSARVVPPDARIIVAEGNYLLLRDAPWDRLRGLWDLTVFLDVPMAELERRLIARWHHYGLSDADARRRAFDNDIPNARIVTERSVAADIVVAPDGSLGAA
jgi:hypothetical protein